MRHHQATKLITRLFLSALLVVCFMTFLAMTTYADHSWGGDGGYAEDHQTLNDHSWGGDQASVFERFWEWLTGS